MTNCLLTDLLITFELNKYLFVIHRSGFSEGKTSSGSYSRHEHSTSKPTQKESDEQLQQIMGFTGFSSTKGKKVDGNNVGEVHVVLKRKYRQYMNRKGGFNRPLDFVA